MAFLLNKHTNKCYFAIIEKHWKIDVGICVL